MEIKYNYYRKSPPIFVFNNEKFKQYPLNSRYYIGENGTVYCIDGFLVTQFINLIYKIKHKVLWKHISDKYKI